MKPADIFLDRHDETPRFSSADVTGVAESLVYPKYCECGRTDNQAVAVELLRCVLLNVLDDAQSARRHKKTAAALGEHFRQRQAKKQD